MPNILSSQFSKYEDFLLFLVINWCVTKQLVDWSIDRKLTGQFSNWWLWKCLKFTGSSLCSGFKSESLLVGDGLNILDWWSNRANNLKTQRNILNRLTFSRLLEKIIVWLIDHNHELLTLKKWKIKSYWCLWWMFGSTQLCPTLPLSCWLFVIPQHLWRLNINAIYEQVQHIIKEIRRLFAAPQTKMPPRFSFINPTHRENNTTIHEMCHKPEKTGNTNRVKHH